MSDEITFSARDVVGPAETIRILDERVRELEALVRTLDCWDDDGICVVCRNESPREHAVHLHPAGEHGERCAYALARIPDVGKEGT